MKKYFYLALAATTMAACTNDVDYSSSDQGNPNNTIGFQVLGRNSITRAQSLQDAGHYNFGVFAYKSSDNVNNVMSNYLVGYMDDANGYKKSGSTTGDKSGVEDGKSCWMYEGLGKDEYFGTYAGGALDTFYTSNNARQFLKYWDKSAGSTCFYAYAPYVGTTDAGKNLRVTYVDGQAQSATGGDTYVMNIPNGTIVAGYDDASRYEFMYASAKVLKAEYGHDVSLDFNRLVAKVNIKFWEDIPGYKVRILDLKEGTDGYHGVQAAASIKDNTSGKYGYKGGKYYVSNGVKIQFAAGEMTGIRQYNGATAGKEAPLVFDAPTDAKIGENRYAASKSATTYYAIPKGSSEYVLADNSTDFTEAETTPNGYLALTGFTFHVSYELTADDSGERIIVKDATVHVPCEYCNWKENTHYTYIFKITTNSNGSSETTPDIDPTDPEVPTVQSLYPIVFDNCTVQDWDENESEWEITQGTALSYHNIELNKYSLVSGDITVTINDGDKHNGHTLDYSAVKVYGPNDETTDVTSTMYDSNTKKITVADGTAAGLYTVVYTCPGTDVNGNHPNKWKAHFVVGNEYTVTTHHDVIGCNGTEVEAKLNVTATKDGDPYTSLSNADLKIDYPTNFIDAQKENVTIVGTDVVVKKNATPGVYKVVLTIDEGSAVKVAEKTFEVKDFNFDINSKVVLSKGMPVDITCSQWNSDITNKAYTTSLSTAAVNGNKITVPNGSAEDTYKITYTTWNGTDSEGNEDAAKVTYAKNFVVRNTHSVTVDAELDRNVGTSNGGEYSTAKIEIKTIVNGNATTTDLTGKLSIVKSDKTTGTDDDDFKITYKSGNTYELTCKAGVATGTYYVKFVNTVAGADAPEYASFVVVE